MEIMRIKRVLFGLSSTLLLSIIGITVLDERFFRPLYCASTAVSFSPSVYKIQSCDSPTFHDIMSRVALPAASVDHTYYLPSESPLMRSTNISVIKQATPFSFDAQPIELSMAFQTPWNNKCAPLFFSQRSIDHEITLFAQKSARYGSKPSAPSARVKAAKTGATRLWLDRHRGLKKKKAISGKGSSNVKKTGKKKVNALSATLYSRSKRKQARERSIPPSKFLPLTNLKPIAPSATIKPQKAHDSWRKLRKHPIFTWPLDPIHFWVSSQFGPRKKPNGSWALHAGVDLAAVKGTPVRAAREGKVIKATYSSGYGNYILIEHSKKYQTRYAHLDKILVREGQSVCTGDCIGKVGSTGFVRKSRWGSSGSHLHFEVYVYGKAKDPFYFLA